MALISIQNLCLGFGGPWLLDHVNLQIHRGERLCLLGRNGTGKSTLMKLINGDVVPDAGAIVRQQGVSTACLTQEVPEGVSGTVFEVVARGLGSRGELLAEYHQLSARLAGEGGGALTERLSSIQQSLDTDDGWQIQREVEKLISHAKLALDDYYEALSAGLKRRVLLARAMVWKPDVLLLDEPTNHLDIESVQWLEDFLLRWGGTLLFVTHDRTFLRKLATRVLEIDRGRLTDWSCDYDTFLKRKASALEAEARQQVLSDKKLAREEAWIRQGIKARRTRNQGRVRALKKLREARRARRERDGTVRMQLQAAERSGKLVIRAENVSYYYNDRPFILDFSTTIMRGDKIGIIGPNGSGKTTLLRILLKTLAPQQGRVRHGTRLEVAYFDQLREQLDGEKTVQENIGDGKDTVTIDGKPRHVISYLKDFLFTPDRARSPVRILSGGERNRLLLARLFTRPANLLVLDEPTNDLDIETMELLEERLLDYPGTLLLVSHDRTFLNNVVTSTLVFEGQGRVNEYVGGYDDGLRQRAQGGPVEAKPAAVKTEKKRRRLPSPRKLSYKEQRELEALPEHIENLESEQAQLFHAMAEPAFFQQSGSEIAEAKDRLAALEKDLETAYERWEALEAIREGNVSASGVGG